MSLDKIREHFEEAQVVLENFMNETNFNLIQQAGELMVNSIKGGGKIMSCGNGGSMCDAMHFAEELTGRYRENRRPLAAISIGDASHITCTANDYGYDAIFSRMVEGLGKEGDVLLAISTSGNSPNIVAAARKAQDLGIKVVALTGKSGGTLKDVCDVEIRISHQSWSDRIQEIHIKIIHCLIDYIESNVN